MERMFIFQLEKQIWSLQKDHISLRHYISEVICIYMSSPHSIFFLNDMVLIKYDMTLI